MKKSSYAIFGLGRFGSSVANELLDAECEVMVIDKCEEYVQEFAEKATYAVRADVTEPGVLESLGIGNVDVVIIAMAGDLEANIMTAMYAKELGVSWVLSKASSPLHGAILNKIGVDRVIYPEREMGKRVARNMLSGGFVDLVELAGDFSLAEIKVPQGWTGKSLAELNTRDVYRVNVVAIKNGDQINVNINPHQALQDDDLLVILGDNDDLNKLSN